jgi:hypothetical protein
MMAEAADGGGDWQCSPLPPELAELLGDDYRGAGHCHLRSAGWVLSPNGAPAQLLHRDVDGGVPVGRRMYHLIWKPGAPVQFKMGWPGRSAYPPPALSRTTQCRPCTAKIISLVNPQKNNVGCLKMSGVWNVLHVFRTFRTSRTPGTSQSLR